MASPFSFGPMGGYGGTDPSQEQPPPDDETGAGFLGQLPQLQALPQAPQPQGPLPSAFPGDPAFSMAYGSLSPQERLLEGEYRALRGTQAAYKLAELDKAAKFRRALGMLTQTFATVSGRPDIADFAEKSMQKEDLERADQIHSQMLAHVGLRALEREREQLTLGAAKVQQQANEAYERGRRSSAQLAARAAGEARRRAGGYTGDEKPSMTELTQALVQSYGGDSTALQELDKTYSYDPNAAAAALAGAKAVATEPSKIRVGKAILAAPLEPAPGEPAAPGQPPKTITAKKAEETAKGTKLGRQEPVKGPMKPVQVEKLLSIEFSIPSYMKLRDWFNRIPSDQLGQVDKKLKAWATEHRERLGDPDVNELISALHHRIIERAATGL